jgi:hypothetical protein
VTDRRRKRQYVILPVQEAAAEARDPTPAALPGKSRHELIAEAAYARAARRGFRDGDPLADWLAAEVEIDAMLAREGTD